MRYDAVIFDNDGVLIEPTELSVLTEAIREAFAAFGVSEPATEHVEGALGVTPDDLSSICEEYGLTASAFWEARDRKGSRAQQAEIRAGRKALYDDVSALSSLDLDLGVVSNNQHETVEFIVEHFGLDDLFETVYGREPTVEGVRRKKPNSHYIEAAMDDLGATDALYVGDSNVDLVAAERAGLDAAFVRRAHREEYELDREPTYELGDLTELADVVTGDVRPGR